MSEEPEFIDHTNFNDYFFDVRRNRPKPGQVLARFSAVAIFGEGREKMDVIKLLKKNKAKEAAQVMKKLHCAMEPDCYRVCRQMCEDLAAGMTEEEVNKKDYEFNLEMLYYTQRSYVPTSDLRWELLPMLDFDPETGVYKATIHL